MSNYTLIVFYADGDEKSFLWSTAALLDSLIENRGQTALMVVEPYSDDKELLEKILQHRRTALGWTDHLCRVDGTMMNPLKIIKRLKIDDDPTQIDFVQATKIFSSEDVHERFRVKQFTHYFVPPTEDQFNFINVPQLTKQYSDSGRKPNDTFEQKLMQSHESTKVVLKLIKEYSLYQEERVEWYRKSRDWPEYRGQDLPRGICEELDFDILEHINAVL